MEIYLNDKRYKYFPNRTNNIAGFFGRAPDNNNAPRVQRRNVGPGYRLGD